jgi:hemoglobin-like flavoprotein
MHLGPENIGREIFNNLFELKPEFQDLFSFASLPNYEQSDEYKDHIMIVVNTVNKAIENLENLGSLLPILSNLGS